MDTLETAGAREGILLAPTSPFQAKPPPSSLARRRRSAVARSRALAIPLPGNSRPARPAGRERAGGGTSGSARDEDRARRKPGSGPGSESPDWSGCQLVSCKTFSAFSICISDGGILETSCVEEKNSTQNLKLALENYKKG
ncbi:uncharacterized protein LOC116558986 isoform X2 [Sapajus apella]|nr:uncharacterized protein LOC116558986 isoform X2 [Sapajus apella]